MAAIGWYNENQGRDYPFVPRARPLDYSPGPLADVPREAVVDFGAIVSDRVPYAHSTDKVYLASIHRSGTSLTFEFAVAVDAADEPTRLRFTRDGGTAEIVGSWADAADDSSSSDVADCPQNAAWRGFLVTGDLTGLLDTIANGATRTFGEGLWQVEPARVQSLYGTIVRSLTLANAPRVVSELTEDCDSTSLEAGPTFPDGARIAAACLQGPVRFVEGYNCEIRQDPLRNALIIGAGVGGGAGEPCGEVPYYPEELPPTGSRLLSGGPTCGEVVKTINGLGGPNLVLRGGAGIRVVSDPATAGALRVVRDLRNFATCLGLADDVSASSSSSSTAPP